MFAKIALQHSKLLYTFCGRVTSSIRTCVQKFQRIKLPSRRPHRTHRHSASHVYASEPRNPIQADFPLRQPMTRKQKKIPLLSVPGAKHTHRTRPQLLSGIINPSIATKSERRCDPKFPTLACLPAGSSNIFFRRARVWPRLVLSRLLV